MEDPKGVQSSTQRPSSGIPLPHAPPQAGGGSPRSARPSARARRSRKRREAGSPKAGAASPGRPGAGAGQSAEDKLAQHRADAMAVAGKVARQLEGAASPPGALPRAASPQRSPGSPPSAPSPGGQGSRASSPVPERRVHFKPDEKGDGPPPWAQSPRVVLRPAKGRGRGAPQSGTHKFGRARGRGGAKGGGKGRSSQPKGAKGTR